MTQTCCTCYWWKRKWAHQGICWQFSVRVEEDETWPCWTATGGSITAKWAAIYEVGADILCFCLLDSGGADVTATTGNTLTVAAHASGVFTLS